MLIDRKNLLLTIKKILDLQYNCQWKKNQLVEQYEEFYPIHVKEMKRTLKV